MTFYIDTHITVDVFAGIDASGASSKISLFFIAN
jgi:hypothetical protein